MAALCLGLFALVAPMLVLCEDGAGHAAIESAISLCCPQGWDAQANAHRAPESRGATGNDCGGSCTDTPFLMSIDACPSRSADQVTDATVMLPVVELASCPRPSLSGFELNCGPTLSPPNLSRLTVLRI